MWRLTRISGNARKGLRAVLAGHLNRARNHHRSSRLRGLLASLALLPGMHLQAAQEFQCDLLIRNGWIVDGAGTPAYRGDVAIRGDRIVRIGRLGEVHAGKVIEAGRLIVAPGFVDMMGQTASGFLTNPQAGNNLLSQGVTTILTGEGVSAAPVGANQGKTNGWQTMAQYFAALEKKGLPMNVAQTVGHTQVRRLVVGETDRAPTPQELIKMKALVAEAMEAGAIGLSTALIYPPAVYASTDELVSLCQVVGQYGGRYYTHMRNEGDRLIEAIDEALAIGAAAGVPVHIFHLKAAGRANWGKMPLAIARLKAAQAAGQEVDADVYPYINNGLGLDSFINPRHFTQGEEAFRRKLSSSTERAEMRREMEEGEGWENWYAHCGRDWDKVIVSQIAAPAYRQENGHSIGEIARKRKKEPWEVFWDIVRNGAFALPETMSEANVISALKEDFVSVCTDMGPAGGSNISGHPRAYGAFPRVLSRYVRELGLFSTEQAVRHMSALACNQVMAYDRGHLSEGQAADIVVFDRERIADRATFSAPKVESQGIQTVIVNGQVVWDHDKFTGALPGRILRGPGYNQSQKEK